MTLSCVREDILPPDLGACPLQQTARYGAAMRAIGAETACLVWRNGREIVATAQILHRKIGPAPLIWLPRGPQNVGANDLRQAPFARLSIAIPESLDHATSFNTIGFRPLLTPQTIAELALAPSSVARRASLHGKWRNRLKSAEAGPLTITHRPFDPDKHDKLLRLESVQRRARGYRALPTGFTAAYASDKQATRLFLAHNGAALAGFMLFLLHPPVATYHIGWAGPEGRQSNAHTLLLWQASEYLHQKRFTRLDLGSLDTENAPGLARFKLGSGATARQLGPTMLRVPFLSKRQRAA